MLLQSSHWLIHKNFNPKNSSTRLNQFVVNWHFNLSPRRQPQQKLTPRTARVTINLCNMKFCIPLPISMKYWNFSAGVPLVRWDNYLFYFYELKIVPSYHPMHRIIRHFQISSSICSNRKSLNAQIQFLILAWSNNLVKLSGRSPTEIVFLYLFIKL